MLNIKMMLVLDLIQLKFNKQLCWLKKKLKKQYQYQNLLKKLSFNQLLMRLPTGLKGRKLSIKVYLKSNLALMHLMKRFGKIWLKNHNKNQKHLPH